MIQQVEAQIARLTGSSTRKDPAAEPFRARRKHNLSKEARDRISAAQHKRWAKAKGKAQVTHAEPKRKMSKEGRDRIAEATKKRWAEYRAQKAAKPKTAGAAG